MYGKACGGTRKMPMKGNSYGQISEKHGYTQKTLAGVIGKARSTVTEILTLNRLIREIRDECRSNKTVSGNTP